MTAAAFVDAITTMKGLLPGMVEHLKGMAPKLTGQERDEALTALRPLNDDIVRLEQEQEEILTKGAKELSDIRHEHLPKIKTLAEQHERGMAETTFDQKVQTL